MLCTMPPRHRPSIEQYYTRTRVEKSCLLRMLKQRAYGAGPVRAQETAREWQSISDTYKTRGKATNAIHRIFALWLKHRRGLVPVRFPKSGATQKPPLVVKLSHTLGAYSRPNIEAFPKLVIMTYDPIEPGRNEVLFQYIWFTCGPSCQHNEYKYKRVHSSFITWGYSAFQIYRFGST